MSVGAIKLGAIPLGLLIAVVLARTLGAEAFGQYTFVMALVSLFSLPVAGGMPQLLTREIAGFFYGNDWSSYRGALNSAHVWVFGASVLVLAIYWLVVTFTQLLPSGGKWGLLPAALLLLPLNGLNAVRNGAIRGMGKPALAELPVQLLGPLAFLVLLGAVASSHRVSAHTAVMAQIGSAVATLLVASWLLAREQPTIVRSAEPKYELRYWRAAFLPFSLLSLVGVINAQIGILVLGILGSDEQVAAMRIAERGAQLVSLSLVMANLVIAPHIVQAYRSGNRAKLQRLAKTTARGCFFIALPVVLMLLVFGHPLVDYVFGPEYGEIAYLPLMVLAFGQLLNVFFGSVGNLLSMSNHERDTLIGQVIAVIVNLTLCIFLVPIYGAIGAAVGVSLGMVVWNFVLSTLVVKRLGVRSSIL